MKTFIARNAAGKPLEVEQLATFAASIQGEQFRFVVTREAMQAMPVVTHRASGYKVCTISGTSRAAAMGNWAEAGKRALRNLVTDKGEARVASALRDAEAKATNGAGKA